jgi:uncharacterized alkaline shock family protein YloU
MTTDENAPLGRIEISRRAIKTLASQAALQSYGVIGMATRDWWESLMRSTAQDPRQGVEIRYEGDEICVDLYVILEYGTRIAAVARSMADSVHYQLERTLGLAVREVNVHVQGLRVSNPY